MFLFWCAFTYFCFNMFINSLIYFFTPNERSYNWIPSVSSEDLIQEALLKKTIIKSKKDHSNNLKNITGAIKHVSYRSISH